MILGNCMICSYNPRPETIIFLMQLHLPYSFWAYFQYAGAAVQIFGLFMIYSCSSGAFQDCYEEQKHVTPPRLLFKFILLEI